MILTNTTRAMVIAGRGALYQSLVQQKELELEAAPTDQDRKRVRGNLLVLQEMDWPLLMNTLITIYLDLFSEVELAAIAKIPDDPASPKSVSERLEIATHEKSKVVSATFIPIFRRLEQDAVARIKARA